MVLARVRERNLNGNAQRTWFITPNIFNIYREDEAAHQKLVIIMKEMITAQSTKYHYIRDGKIFSVCQDLTYAYGVFWYPYNFDIHTTLDNCQVYNYLVRYLTSSVSKEDSRTF